MPELPDLSAYLHALRLRVLDQPIEHHRIAGPFLLRSVDPPIDAIDGRCVRSLRRLGKRIVFGLDGDLFLVFHLMIAGRFRWRDRPPQSAQRKNRTAPRPAKIELATFTFPAGTLALTEAASKKRASLHLVRGEAGLAAHDPGGLEMLDADAKAFRAALTRESHTLKRALTDPRLFAGIGNAYSDEILHAAQLSPVQLTRNLAEDEIVRLHRAARDTLRRWTNRLCREFAARFPGPGDVTAFRPDFAVHGRFGKPCPACGAAVQRIRYADNETNYCPRCQTGGRLLADRSLSRLLKDDWPRSIDDPGCD